jgi:hypothetical protein
LCQKKRKDPNQESRQKKKKKAKQIMADEDTIYMIKRKNINIYI